jgi:phosphatidylserine synthase
MQFDSLCDLVAFGVAPSIIVYSYSLNDYKSKGSNNFFLKNQSK